MPSRNTIEIILNARDDASQVLDRVAGGLENFGGRLQSAGAGMVGLFAPAVAGFGVAVNAAMSFDEALTNISAVTSIVGDDLDVLKAQLLDIGENSRYGPQAIAEAYYDVAGGVTNAAVRMDVLNAAIATAQAGNADLTATTSALIGVMNSYNFSAEQATYASDVLTRAVGMGVGTMDGLAAAIPSVTGLASSLSIEFADLAAMTSFLTTKGSTWGEATTQLSGMMSALLKPSAQMTEALASMGFESGRAAIEALGLTGVYEQLVSTFGQNALGGLVGEMEALRGVTALTAGGFEEFSQTFIDGLEGATAAAEAVQMRSAAAQFDRFKAQMQGLAISIGDALLPGLNKLLEVVTPVIDKIGEWAKANPELIATIAGIVTAGAALGGAMVVVGSVISNVGTVLRFVAPLLAALTSPIGLLVAGGAALAQVLGVDVVGGLQSVVHEVETFIGRIGENGLGGAIELFFTTFDDGSNAIGNLLKGLGMTQDQANVLGADINRVVGRFGEFFGALRAGVPVTDALSDLLLDLLPRDVATGVVNAVKTIGKAIGDVFTGAKNVVAGVSDAIRLFITGDFKGGMFGGALEDSPIVDYVLTARERVLEIIPQITEALGNFFGWLGEAWETARPGLEGLWQWFTQDALPAVVAFVTEQVIPGIGRLFQWLAGAWETVRPYVEGLVTWFTQEALPGVISFIETDVIPGIGRLFSWLEGAWETARPYVEALVTWFTQDALPGVIKFVTERVIPGIGKLFDWLSGVWETARPYVEAMVTWFTETALPGVIKFIEGTVIPGIGKLFTWLQGVWDTVSPYLEALITWFTVDALPGVVTFIEGTIIPGIDKLVTFLKDLWTTVEPFLISFRDGIKAIFDWVIVNVIDPVVNAIEGIITELQRLAGISVTPPGTNSATPLLPGPIGYPGFPPRDMGGMGVAGQPYLIGTGAQPEVFIPRTNGQFIPNADRLGGNSITIESGAVVVHVNGGNPEEVEQAVYTALVRLAEEP